MNDKIFKMYETEEAYANEVKSLTSKGKNELLQEMQVSSVAEVKDLKAKAEKAVTLENKVTILEEEKKNLEYKFEAVKSDCRPDMVDNIVTLATVKPKEGKTVIESIAIYTKELGAENKKPDAQNANSVDPTAPVIGVKSNAEIEAQKIKNAEDAEYQKWVKEQANKV